MKFDREILLTGRIHEIIRYLQKTRNCSDVKELSTEIKLDILCKSLQLVPEELDNLIADNPPVLRTVVGHAFEEVFETIVSGWGCKVKGVGGDQATDLIVNGKNLQLKTPYKAGTRGTTVSYKTHKTHGAKSERESLDYYHSVEHFPDFLVGLVSYRPFRVLILSRDELPTHPYAPERIQSPFNILWHDHKGLNAFHRIGMEEVDVSNIEHLIAETNSELLPKSAKKLRLNSEIILNTILRDGNFRVWDMTVRGFSREVYFKNALLKRRVIVINPVDHKSSRGDKADLALWHIVENKAKFFQMKGVSSNNCKFDGVNSIVATETQLTRGRVNDHPTQSRLYLKTDFDFLILGIDPILAAAYNNELGQVPELKWEYYVIPTDLLVPHHLYPHRLNSIQKLRYLDLAPYRVSDDWETWASQWQKGTVLKQSRLKGF